MIEKKIAILDSHQADWTLKGGRLFIDDSYFLISSQTWVNRLTDITEWTIQELLNYIGY